jgi:hypothetical protein
MVREPNSLGQQCHGADHHAMACAGRKNFAPPEGAHSPGALYYARSMPGRRRPWVTSLLALVLGPVGFVLMLSAEAIEDYSAWSLVIAAVQLLWLWLVDLRGPDQGDQTRMFLMARITAAFVIALAAGVISAALLMTFLEFAARAGMPDDWFRTAEPLALVVLPIVLPLVWGLLAWRVSKRRTPRAAVRAMLGWLTVFSLLAVGLAWVAYDMARDSHEFLALLLPTLALSGALIVLAWTALPWLELYLTRAGSSPRGPRA